MAKIDGSKKVTGIGKGLTWRSLMAFVFLVFVIQPAIVYNWLVNGLWGFSLASWAIILLWVGLTRLLGSPLSSKEIFVIRLFETTGLTSWAAYIFVTLLQKQYFANSPIATLFGIEHIPSFFAPLGSDAARSMLYRTFFDQAWVLPILTQVCIPIFLSAFANYTLGLLSYRLYVEEEKLEFPFASIDASTMKAFGERDKNKIKVITLAIIAGIIYGFGSTGTFQIIGISLVPRLLVDFTPNIEPLLPGSALPFSTDLLYYIQGFILPIQVTALQLVGTIGLYIFGNNYVTVNNLWPAESPWKPGQGAQFIIPKSQLYFWNSLTIGWGIAVAVIPLLVRYKTVLRAFTSTKEKKSVQSTWFTSRNLFIIFLITAISSVVSTWLLVPGFPLWVLLAFTMGISVVITFLQTNSAGVTYGLSVPYLRETLIYFSGYKNPDIWFVEPGTYLFTGGSGIAQQLKMAQIVGVDTKEYTKAYFLVLALGVIGSGLFVSIFWRIQSIPGWAYPYTISAWPVQAMDFWRWQSWLWTGYLFRENWIVMGFSASTVVYLISDFVFHFPAAGILMLVGMQGIAPMGPWWTLHAFIGSIISKAISKFVGEKLWDSNKGYIMMGILIGDSIISTLAIILSLVARSTWLKPY